VLEYLPGQDLFWILKNEHNLQLGKIGLKRRDWVTYYSSEIVVALETLHTMHVIYRDLKPENVMIDKTGHIKLIDFGFAKQLDAKRNFRTSTNCGTLGYNAPELISGAKEYSFPADIWSFGILVAELLSG
jgi:serine/threonine protein kinase